MRTLYNCVLYGFAAVAAYVLLFLLPGSALPETEAEPHRQGIAVVSPTVTPAPTYWARYPVPMEDALQRYVVEQCQARGVPPEIVMAIIERESDFNSDARGDGGRSYGLMQIRQDIHRDRCIALDAPCLLDPYQNIRVGVDYLAELLSWGHGLEYALSWYNGHGGEPCDYAREVMARAEYMAESVMIVEG